MDLKINSTSTASLKIGIQETMASAIKSIPVTEIKKALLNTKRSVIKYFRLANASVKRVSILLIEVIVSFLRKTILLLTSLRNLLRRRTTPAYINPGEPLKRNVKFPFKKLIKPFALTLVAILVVVGISKLVGGVGKTGGATNKIQVQGAKAVQEINREFTFPLRDGNDDEVSKIKYFIEKAELLDEIIVKGQRATAVSGRTFLIVTLKITNEYDKPIEIDTRDYLRLSVNKNEEEWLAPDIHNDPVEVQAISTKFTRVGFPINESDTDLVLRVGEINGDKETIPLTLK